MRNQWPKKVKKNGECKLVHHQLQQFPSPITVGLIDSHLLPGTTVWFPRMLLYSPTLPHHFCVEVLWLQNILSFMTGEEREVERRSKNLCGKEKRGLAEPQKKKNIAASKLPVAPRWQVQKTQVPSFCSTPRKSITHTSYKIVAVQVMRFTLQETKQHLNLAFSFFGKIGNGCTLEWLWSKPASHGR